MAHEDREQMTIGRIAEAAGVAATTLRYYEREGILHPGGRSRAGYRLYDAEALRRLEFIRAAQAVGFTLDDVRALLRLNGESPCKEVRALIERRLSEVDVKLTNLKRVREALADALRRCRRSKKGCAVVAGLKKDANKRRTT